MGLRWLNGHAVKTEDGKSQRLIVEFAIENAQIVARRKELQAKTGAFQPGGNRNNNTGNRDERNNSRFPPRGKDFSVSKGKWQGQDGKGRGRNDSRPKDAVKAASRDSANKEALQQKIIARKRMTRKKKANNRS